MLWNDRFLIVYNLCSQIDYTPTLISSDRIIAPCREIINHYGVSTAPQMCRNLSAHAYVWLHVCWCGLYMQHVGEKKNCPMERKRPYGAEKRPRASHEQLARGTNKQTPPFSQHQSSLLHCYYRTQPRPEDTNSPHARWPLCSTWPTDLHMEIYTSWVLRTVLHCRKKTQPAFERYLRKLLFLWSLRGETGTLNKLSYWWRDNKK